MPQSSSSSSSTSRDRDADYRQALQPITTTTASHQSTKILKDLAPQLLHPRILNSPAFLNGGLSGSSSSSASSSSSSHSITNRSSASDLISLSNPRNAFIALARLSKTPTLNLVQPGSVSTGFGTRRGKGGKIQITSTDLRILEGVDRLLSLPVPAASSSSTSSISRRLKNGLPTLREDDEEDDQNEENDDDESEEKVNLLEGFNATMPAARARKLARRKRRAILSERQLGITAGVNELGLKERGDRARGLLGDGGDGQYVVDSIESTPKKRIVKSKRRTSFMPIPLQRPSTSASTTSTSTEDLKGGGGEDTMPMEELLTKPELEQDLKEIKQDKKALLIRRKLTLKDLNDLEDKMKKLELLKDELGRRLLELKEEELELDDELEGVTDRLAQLEARQSGRAVSSTSSRRRKGPAFLPSEHDALPPNVAFMTLTSRNTNIANSDCSVTSLDFSEPYGLLVASYSATSSSNSASSGGYFHHQQQSHSHAHQENGQVSVFDLTDGEELARLQGHRGIVKALLVEGDMAISGGEDGKIALWDLTKAVEDGLPEESDIHKKSNFVGGGRGGSNGRLDEEEEDVFFNSRPSSANGRKAGQPNGTVSGHQSAAEEDDDEFPPLPSPIPLHKQSMSNEDDPTPSAARMKLLEGHSKAVTCLSYENTSLVSGSSDKTLRLWDLNTGQCVVTMDILWAISNPLPVDADPEEEAAARAAAAADNNMSKSLNNLPPQSPAQYAADSDYPWNTSASPAYMTPRTKKTSLSGLRRLSSQAYNLATLAGSLPNSPSTPTASLANFNFTQATPPYADGTWEMYSDFVGGLQLWSYALASGSADGCVRMWDTRTGQSVRSLIGHTSAVTCLQFDNLHLVSGSLDKTVRVWDLRTGRTIESLRYEGPVTSLQFDSRRIMVAGGTNNVQVFNRTTLQQTELMINGHTSPVERLRFMDRYLATGARDSTVKIWSLN